MIIVTDPIVNKMTADFQYEVNPSERYVSVNGVYGGKVYVEYAFCAEEDTFSSTTGMALAGTRLEKTILDKKIKNAYRRFQDREKEIDEVQRELNRLIKENDKLIKYTDKLEKQREEAEKRLAVLGM